MTPSRAMNRHQLDLDRDLSHQPSQLDLDLSHQLNQLDLDLQLPATRLPEFTRRKNPCPKSGSLSARSNGWRGEPGGAGVEAVGLGTGSNRVEAASSLAMGSDELHQVD